MLENSLLRRMKFLPVVAVISLITLVPSPAQAETQPWEPVPAEATYSSEIRDALLAHYSSWVGTRHKLGGTDTDGVDCSSFIQTLFQDRFQTSLPRSSREQMALGERVEVNNLKSGDLLFFRTGPTRSHVGVYVGNNQFLHVSTRAGVEIAKLFSPYWKRNFITARRLGAESLIPSN